MLSCLTTPLPGTLTGALLGSTMPAVRAQTHRRRRGSAGAADSRFVIYYGLRDQPALDGYDIVVLDSDVDPAIPRRLAQRGLVLGYVSIGEVHSSRAWSTDVDRQGLLLTPNPQWPDARFVDLRDPRWKSRLLDDLLPGILARGFSGLFLDTLDDAAFLESVDASRYAGMVDAAADLVHSLRGRFPHIPIMVNRGYALLPRIVSDIDMLLGESIHTTWDAASDSYIRVTPAALRWQTDKLNEARSLSPGLMLYSLDYWSPRDPDGIARIYAEARSNGFIPYVATFDLTQIVPR